MRHIAGFGRLTQILNVMKNGKKNVGIDSENVLKAVALGSACVAVASLGRPAAPVVGGLGCVCAKTIPSLLRGHVFF